MSSLADVYFVAQTALPALPSIPKVRAAYGGTNSRSPYDAAQYGDPDLNSWFAHAHNMGGPNSTSDQGTRQRLRDRCRAEVLNNPLLVGIERIKQNAIVGTGPRVQVETGDDDANRLIEDEFLAWCRAVNLTQILRMMIAARITDGEAFAELVTHPNQRHPVKLYPRLVEADLFTNPLFEEWDNPFYRDGIWFHNPSGLPERFNRLKHHPSDYFANIDPFDADVLNADQVLYWRHTPRPGQLRGIPELTPCLTLCAQLRRFTQSTLSSADAQAKFSGVMESQVAYFADNPASSEEPFLNVPMPGGSSFLTLPEGWSMNQLRVGESISDYEGFSLNIILQISRTLNVPYQLAIGSSKDSNFASARLDLLNFNRQVDIERDDLCCTILTPLFRQWWQEARLIPEYMPLLPETLRHRWTFDRHVSINEKEEANTAKTLMELGVMSDERYLLQRGEDVVAHDAAMARQIRRRSKLGIPQPWDKPSEAQQPEPEAVEDDANVDPELAGAF